MPKQILFLRKVSVSVVLYRYPCRFPTGRNDSFISLKPKVSLAESKFLNTVAKLMVPLYVIILALAVASFLTGTVTFTVDGNSQTIDLTLNQMKDFTKIISESALEIYGKDQKELLLRGKIIHYALSKILTYDGSEIDQKIENAVNLTLLEYSNEDLAYR